MKYVFSETFRSPLKDTREAAEFALRAIRELHDEAHGWYEEDARIEHLPNGKWQAVRVHVHKTA